MRRDEGINDVLLEFVWNSEGVGIELREGGDVEVDDVMTTNKIAFPDCLKEPFSSLMDFRGAVFCDIVIFVYDDQTVSLCDCV